MDTEATQKWYNADACCMGSMDGTYMVLRVGINRNETTVRGLMSKITLLFVLISLSLSLIYVLWNHLLACVIDGDKNVMPLSLFMYYLNGDLCWYEGSSWLQSALPHS